MLVWFMHGASVRTIGYADSMRNFLVQAFSDRDLPMPEFYSSFWGDALGHAGQLWDWVQQDLEAFRWDHPGVDIEDVFHYRQRREQLISGFFSDIFSYLNTNQGRQVRRIIAVQFLNLLKAAPDEEDLHIVAHSLGSVILWDLLFGDSLAADDPAFYIREVIKGLATRSEGRKVKLRSITTMGSPLLFFKLLEPNVQSLAQFASRYRGAPLRWLNVIHASDVFAYPLRASLNLDTPGLRFWDQYLGEQNFLKRNVADVAMALGLTTEHSRYWRSRRVGKLVTANLLGEEAYLEIVNPVLLPGEED